MGVREMLPDDRNIKTNIGTQMEARIRECMFYFHEATPLGSSEELFWDQGAEAKVSVFY